MARVEPLAVVRDVTGTDKLPTKLVQLGWRMVKSETRRDAETGILKSEPEMKKCSDLIGKHMCDRQTQNLRIRDPLESSARFRDLGRICRDSQFLEDHSPPLTVVGV